MTWRSSCINVRFERCYFFDVDFHNMKFIGCDFLDCSFVSCKSMNAETDSPGMDPLFDTIYTVDADEPVFTPTDEDMLYASARRVDNGPRITLNELINYR